MKNTHGRIRPMILAALCLALAFVLPYLTGHIPELGAMLCPMHLPVLLCGFVCGAPWGAAVGLVAPLLRSLLTGGFPPMFPTAVCMALELCTYGTVAGAMHRVLPSRRPYIYCSLLCAMVAGRLVWGAAMLVCMGLTGNSFSLSAFLAGAVTGAIPGILLQMVLIPLIVMALSKALSTPNPNHHRRR